MPNCDTCKFYRQTSDRPVSGTCESTSSVPLWSERYLLHTIRLDDPGTKLGPTFGCENWKGARGDG